jgi:Transmembrane domain of unknown function (DUF3566)
VELDLIRANQTRLTGDNLVSVNGAEEDGVDNRVEAPAWAPDEGSDGTSPAQLPDDAAQDAPESASAAETSPANDGAAAPHASNGAQATADDQATRTSAAQPGLGAPRPGPVFAPTGLKSGGPQTAPFPAAMDAAAGAARGLAAKVASPFSSLTRPKPGKSSGKSKVRKPPPGGGPRPRPSPGPRPQPRLTPTQPPGAQVRRAQLRLDRIEPWSVMKFSFLISLVGWVILFVAVAVLYFALSKLGVFTSIEHTVGLVTSNKSNPTGSNAASWFKASRVLGYTMLVGAINVILITALATVGAVLYNLVTMLAGGVEVTLRESD